MIREKVINNSYVLKVGTAKYLRVPMRSPKSKFPIRIIVFNRTPFRIVRMPTWWTVRTGPFQIFYKSFQSIPIQNQNI